MRYFALVLLSLPLLAAIFLGWRSLDGVEYQRRETAARIEAEWQRLALERERLELQQAQATAPAYNALGIVYTALPLAIACLALYIAADAYKQRRTPLVRPDARGQLPVSRVAVEQGQLVEAFTAALTAFHRTQQLQAVYQPQNTPHTFSPHITIAARPEPAPALLATEPVHSEPALPDGVVDLHDRLAAWQPSIGSILLAVGPGGVPYYAHAKDLCHVALAGATGGGKSNIMRLLLAQLLSTGAKVTLADPHFAPYDPESGDDWRPIMQRLAVQPAVKADEIRHMLAWLALEELPKRLERRRNGEHPGTPHFLAIDELPAIVADVKDAPDYLSRLLREGRKVNLLTIGAAQDFLVKTVGGAGGVRDCYRTAYYVGGDAQTARVLLDVKGSVDDGRLGQGLAFLRSKATPTAQLVRVPLASNEALYSLLGGFQPASTAFPLASTGFPQASSTATILPFGKPAGRHVEAMLQEASTASESHDMRTPEQERILALFQAGSDVAAIVKDVYGLTSSGGRKYQDYSAQVQAVLRSALGMAA